MCLDFTQYLIHALDNHFQLAELIIFRDGHGFYLSSNLRSLLQAVYSFGVVVSKVYSRAIYCIANLEFIIAGLEDIY